MDDLGKGLEWQSCPFCGSRLKMWNKNRAEHPPVKCSLDGFVFGDVELWNRRQTANAPAQPADSMEIMLRGAMSMMDELEKIIPRNDGDRDYAETVSLHVQSERAFRASAESRILELEEKLKSINPPVTPALPAQNGDYFRDQVQAMVDFLTRYKAQGEMLLPFTRTWLELAQWLLKSSVHPPSSAGTLTSGDKL